MTPFYRRLFLNKPKHHGSAHIIASVENKITKTKDKKVWKELSARLTIADCSRIVTLDFDAYGNEKNYERELKNVLYKAHTMLHVVQDFVAALEEAIEENEKDD